MARPLDFFDVDPEFIDDSSIEDEYLQEQENGIQWFIQEEDELRNMYEEEEL